MNNTVKILKALADETRLSIVLDFMNGHETICEDIKKELSKSQPTLSHHIGKLKDAGILIETKKGVNCYYKVDTHFLESNGIDLSRLTSKSEPKI